MEWYIVAFVGLLFVAGIGYVAVQGEQEHRRWPERGVKTQGVIVRNEFQPDDVAAGFRAVVRFTTRAGTLVEALDRKSAAVGLPGYAAGTTVTLVYEPTNPYEFEVLGAGTVYPWAELVRPAGS